MIDPVAFILAALTLLATPGPTNTLLAMSGAAAGLRPSLRLLGAELGGYMISILTLGVVLGPLVKDNPAVGIVLKAACATYLIWLAVKLWREGSSSLVSSSPVKFRRVFTTTLLNPKAVIFAFVIVPHLAEGRPLQAIPYLAGLCALIFLVGGSWIALGAGLRARSGDIQIGGWVRRIGAGALVVFAAILGSSAWSTAAAMAH
ncbi:LysE family transporter [Caulobacter sp. SLTY]|uniref:LysE family translocator n=1 Tax=Caulobacter sp. SLTY TaxID=2683262 RepID=UPI0014135DFC|nr:LysE family transporter [Caulobacter sp. SLTY]NBB14704.1 LysE family transporter [Caulobacter sp. SLTY]